MWNINAIVLLYMLPVIIFQGIQTHSYYLLISRADSCFVDNNFRQSLLYFREAFTQFPDSVRSREVVRAIRSAGNIGDTDFVKRSCVRIMPKDSHLDADTYAEIGKIIKDSALSHILNYYNEWHELVKYYSEDGVSLNPQYEAALAKKLANALESDQNDRLIIDSIYRNGSPMKNELLLDSIGKRILHTDSANLNLVTEILERRGFLGVEVVGESGNIALFIILQHADMQPHLQKRFLPVVQLAVEKGKARGQFLALLKDRISIRETGKQFYGTQVEFDQSTGLAVPKPLIDSVNIDVHRASVGLPPLRYYLNLFTKN